MDINIDRSAQDLAMKTLDQRMDAEANRIRRYLSMQDLSRTDGNVLHELISRVKNIEDFANFDDINIPEIVPVDVSFDMFNFADDHPARSRSDTYYVNEENILRTHDTVMWYYYFNDPIIKERMLNKESFGVFCYGKVYRKDEIDRHHMNVFHQMGGLYMVPKEVKELSLDDLKDALAKIVTGLYGPDINYRFNIDTFPYTDPSLEVEVEINGKWIEILGGGMPKMEVLSNFNVEGYNGWAFGFGLERLAIISMDLPDIRLLWSSDERVKKQLVLGHKYVEVSKFPQITRDISFVVENSFQPNDYFDLIRELGGELVEEVSLLDSYENADKFGEGRKSYTYRIIYRSNERTLTNEEIDIIQDKVYTETAQQFQAELR